MPRPPLLIESWLPIEAIGAESKRERGASSALPPLYFLHVWWARRPLIASRAAILASVLPQWSEDWPKQLQGEFPNKETYRNWFIHLVGIRGDPVKGRKLIDWANARGIKLDFHPYNNAPRAFTVNPSTEDLETMSELLNFTWGRSDINVLDPFAGGGSIPFEALRYGFTTFANDLNPVAAVILKATLDYPARYGPLLANDIQKWGEIWSKRVEEKLHPFFPKQPNEDIFAYLWTRTIACPSTGKPVPLSPHWWLRKGNKPVAVKVITEDWMNEPHFEIVSDNQLDEVNPDDGTVSRGVGRSPWTGETIEANYIKAEAQAGRMDQMLYAVATKGTGGLEFRTSNFEDINAFQNSEERLIDKKQNWIAKGIIPTESFPSGNDNRPLRYGMPMWSEFFSPRQLLAMCTYLEEFLTLTDEISQEVTRPKAEAISSYLGIVIDKCADYSSHLCAWDTTRKKIAHVFSRHDYSFTWSYGEFDGASKLPQWSVSQVADAYIGLANLISPSQKSYFEVSRSLPVEKLSVYQGSANSINQIQDHSIHNICMDPPYYDNVQYAELADFFYVWLKRSVGHLFPDFFNDELTNKDDEAVANPARFEGMGRKKKELAEQDYERKMEAAFQEMYRVLHPDGCLTVMFTHKKVEAWDTLASALIGAGFAIKASWPVHTESEHSLHQAKKNAAASTILLACRKREEDDGEPVWWDDLQGRVRKTARQKAEEFAEIGISGVDLYISTFGPTLSIISEHWPVLTSEVDPKTGEPRHLRPETALDLAREEVIRLRKQGLLLGREIQFDQPTDWYLMAWDAFAAEQFPYDEARKLAIAMGVDLDKLLMRQKRLARKKGQYIIIQKPIERRKKDMVDDEAISFEHWVDAAHTAMMIYQEDGAGPCEVFLRKSGLRNDGTFKACLQAMINAIPRTRIKGKFARPEAEVLENLRLAFYDDIEAPIEEEPLTPEGVQLGIWEGEEDTDEEKG